MPIWLGKDPDDTLQWAEALEAGRRRAETAASLWTEAQALRLAHVAAAAPWMDPGVALGLVESEADPQTVYAAAHLSASQMARRPDNVALGEKIRAGRLSPGDPRSARRIQAHNAERYLRFQNSRSVQAQVDKHGLMNDQGQLTSPVAINALMDEDGNLDPEVAAGMAPDRAEAARLFAEILSNASLQERRVHFLEPGGGMGYYDGHTRKVHYKLAGVDPVNPFSLSGVLPEVIGRGVGKVGEFLATHGPDPRFGPSGVRRLPQEHQAAAIAGTSAGSFQEVTQLALAALNAPIQENVGLLRNVYGTLGGSDRPVDWTESQSDLGIILSHPDAERGGGYFIDPDSEVAQIRLDREAERGLIYGQRVTLGRLFTGGLARVGVIEPHDNWYRVGSGLIDVVPQVVDPAALALGGIGKAAQARKIFVGAKAVGAARQAERAAVSTAKLRSLAATFGVRGRGHMDRGRLLNALSIHVDDPKNMKVTDLRKLATTFNITGRTRMAKADLVERVSHRMANLDEVIKPSPVVQQIQATPAPLAFAAGAAEAVRATGVPKLLEKAGIIKGTVARHVHGPSIEAWLQGTHGQRVLREIALTGDAAEIWRLTGKKLTRQEVRALRDASTPTEVADVLRPMLGGRTMRTVDDVWKTGRYHSIPKATDLAEARLLTDVPGHQIDTQDPMAPMREVEAWLRNAHVESEVVNEFLSKVAETDTYDELFEVVEEVMAHTDGVLAKAGVSPEDRAEITRAYRDSMREAQSGLLADAAEQQSAFDAVIVGGEEGPIGTPHAWLAAHNRYIYLPDFREVRRLTSKYPNLGWNAEGQLRRPVSFAFSLQEDIWKPATLLRGAWPIRVIAEEQFRMGAANYASFINDPLSYLGFVLSRRKDIAGDPFELAEQYRRAMMQRTQGWLNERPGIVRTGRQVAFRRNQKGYSAAWGEGLIELHLDPVARRMAESNNLDEVVEWLERGEGRPILDRLIEDNPIYFDPKGRRGQLGLAVRRYVENAAYWNRTMTGGNDELLGVIRTGSFRGGREVGGRALTHSVTNPDGITISQPFLRALRGRFAEAGPNRVMGAAEMSKANRRQRGAVMEKAFAWLMSKPTNYLSRSPVFRQAYWRRIEELVSFAKPKVKAQILEHAREASRVGWGPVGVNVTEAPRQSIRRMEEIQAVGRLTLDEVDAYAKGFALDTVRELLYDLSKRSQIADSMRLVAPFGEAWREVITRWLDLANPGTAMGWRNIRRFAQIMGGMRGEDLGDVLGAPVGLDGDQKGFFWKDEWGEWVFMYPGSQWLMGAITDLTGVRMPVGLGGRVEGLSMFGTIVPGIGPVASLPVAKVLPNKPGWSGNLREVLLPFGSIIDQEGLSAIGQVANYAPTWMRMGVQAFAGGGWDMETNRLYANSTMAAANYLYSTGKFDTTSRAGWDALMEEARKQAQVLYAVRAFSAFGAPSSPSFEWAVETDEGTVAFAFLRDEYHRLVDEHGFEKADEMFLERFGPQVGMSMQAYTSQVTGGVEATAAFGEWAGNNKGLRVDFEHSWGFFGPGGGELDYDVYRDQIAQGHRQAFSMEEWRRAGQNHLGQMLVDKLLAKLGPEDTWTDEDRAAKRRIEERIYDEYPGFLDYRGRERSSDFYDNILPELRDAVNDERVLATEAGQGLALYWRARQKVVDYAHEQGFVNINRAKALATDRARLYEIGTRIAIEYPDFARLWDRHLRHEVQPQEEAA